MKPIIEVKKLYKRYQYGQNQPYLTLRESVIHAMKAPFRFIKSDNIPKNEFWALKNVSFNISPGESIGIIGRNGAGKSTLLKLLSRITPPTRGEIVLRGRVASLLEIGTGFHQELTGRENIFLNGSILGMTQKEIKSKFDEIVEFGEIEKFLDTPVKFYSSGMYMRLAFAVAAHLDSEILLVDEVLAVGDAAFQKKCLGKMENVAKQGRTVLFISHNIGAVRNLCKRTIVINGGSIISDEITDKSLDVYHKLLHETKIDENYGIDNQNIRRGSGAIRFTDVDMRDSNGKKKMNFSTGETVRFELKYKVFRKIKGLYIYIALRSATTREIITYFKHLVTDKTLFAGSIGEAKIEVPQISLKSGYYPIYFYISELEGKKENFDVLDDLTQPLVIVPNKNEALEQSNLKGYFTLSSKLIFKEGNFIQN